MKKLLTLSVTLLLAVVFCGAGYAQQTAKAKLQKEIAVAEFTKKWMDHKNTDVCLQEEVGSDDVVVHRNSWDVVTRFLMAYDISANADGGLLLGKDIITQERYQTKKTANITPVFINTLSVAFSDFYTREYVHRASLAPQSRTQSTDGTRAGDKDFPWNKTNKQLYEEFSKDLSNLKATVIKYELAKGQAARGGADKAVRP